MIDKAYKLLALQEKISNRAAKELIDRGVVYAAGKKVSVARGELDSSTKFKVEKIAPIRVLFEDAFLMAVDKPAFMTSEEVAEAKNLPLLHRLDRETSGVLLLTKDDDFRKKAVNAFKKRDVQKEYIAIVEGKVVEAMEINAPILTIKKGNTAYSKISDDGKEAISYIEPLMIEGKRSKIRVKIETGRTHQIRVHLKSIGASILGDTEYGGRPYKRLMLHASKIALLGYKFESKEPEDFIKFAAV
ncbi:MAG: RluA family pseudouridine synthase [Epsilonproteobacteria bacterium]|jgi:23S rRNA-/tRNA-specific pseudouridylate synthase|uniref:RluA family pseudouridine synthase n=1 Tax=Sulfurospirillum TaxID=57665 RepID=UPI00054316B6|nr:MULTISPECIES: RluA family pseudouridine synthase [Sulfurospirillum]MDY0263832.1 RluA family pseudouridine synthase [Sulfurospirillum cavolei]NCB54234.1 RluA family pseudouridine synthase [Campylobacterota bacterium]KHG34542.1 MAG: ribulose-phosphate 3-epimerase [Sulfurospirillum sp. MES]MCP3650706.1 RluA family pseudouridine synthase [Sulfurospirillum sp. DNRA8]MCR1809551.1 RluA family pseudouridine synthase [Sulfurospirillum sp. DNRA8]